MKKLKIAFKIKTCNRFEILNTLRVLSSATPQLLSKTWEINHQDPFTQKAKQGERRKSRIQSYGFRFKLLEFRVQERG